MKKLLLLTGDLACGKTTFARSLSNRYGIEAYSKDTVKEILGDTVGFSDREQNLKLSRAAVSVMTHIFLTAAPCGHDLILEANFRKDELTALFDKATAYGYDLLLLRFTADEAVLFERFQNRIRYEHRHPVHLSVGLDTFETFRAYIEKARGETAGITAVDIDATTFAYQTDETLLAKLDAFINGRQRTGPNTK